MIRNVALCTGFNEFPHMHKITLISDNWNQTEVLMRKDMDDCE